MAMPKEASIEIPLLYEMRGERRLGSGARPAVYEAVASHFPKLTTEDRGLTNPEAARTSGRIASNGQVHLAKKGEMGKRHTGVWPITDKGRERLQREWPAPQEPEYSDRLYIDSAYEQEIGTYRTPEPSSRTGWQPESPAHEPEAKDVSPQSSAPLSSESAERQAREAILRKLKDMDDSQFEQFVRRFFAKLGYENLNVETLPDGTGVDAECVLKEPFIGPPVTVVWRVARGTAELGASAVRELRTAWEDKADRLVLINPGGFAPDAAKAAITFKGSKAVGLISGQKLTDLMILKGIGISKQTIIVYELDNQFWD